MQHPALHRLFCGLVALSFPVIVHAQVTTAEISGAVRDSSSAVVPGAEVVMVNLGTGISRTLTTDGRGRYEAPNLGLGTYEIVVAAPGFKTDVQSGISLNVGQRIVLNFTLEPGAVSEEITVARESPLVDTTSSQVGALVSRDQIRDLPLNGRDYTQLAMLQPGVVPYREQSKELNRGMGNRFSVSGARHNQVGFRLNGIDIADGVGATPGSATGNNLGVDAIQEFQVLTHTFSAEQGKSGGGIVNVVHKSGTNAFRGTAFEYLRNSALDARNFFDVSDEPPPFKRNQFGGTLGGPVIRNRTFFFGAYEGLRERLALTGINVVVTEAAKSGALGPVDERVQPYLDLMPSPNGRVFADGTGELVSEVKTRSDEDYFVGKVDHTFSSADSISMSYTFDDGRVTKPNPRDGIVTYNTISKNRFQYVTLEGTHIFTPNLLHTVRAGYNQSHVDAVREPLIDFPASLQFVPGVDFSSIEVSGIDRYGMVFAPVVDRELKLDSAQVATSLTWIRGPHSFKTGMEAYRFKVIHHSFGRASGGRYVFDDVPALLAARPTTFQAEDPSAEVRPIIQQNLFGFFIQDDFRATSTLTLNAGLRYEFITTPRSNKPNQSTLVDLTDPELTTGDAVFNNPSLKNFAPRVGVAWDVFGNQRTALRGGLGVYHDQLTSYYYLQVIEGNPPFGLSRSVNGPPFGRGFDLIESGELPSALDLTLLEYNLDQPYRLQYNVGIQQQLGASMAATVYYVGARGYNSSQFFLNANGRPPAGVTTDGRLWFDPDDPPLNPHFGIIQYRTTGGDSWYNSLQLVVNRRPRAGLSFQGSYTWQKSLDTGSIASNSSEGLNTVAQQSIYQADRAGERGLSSFDVRHTFSLNVNYDVPFRREWAGLAKVLSAGWQLSGIVTLTSGHPFTPILGFDNANAIVRSRGDHLRPDLAPGRDNNPTDGGTVEQYFDPTAFVLSPEGTLGNLGRNTLIGPGTSVVDFSMKRRFHLTASKLLEFRAEIFNLFNRANFRIPEDTQRTVINRGGEYNPSAGRITATSTTSRQIQFSLRLEF